MKYFLILPLHAEVASDKFVLDDSDQAVEHIIMLCFGEGYTLLNKLIIPGTAVQFHSTAFNLGRYRVCACYLVFSRRPILNNIQVCSFA